VFLTPTAVVSTWLLVAVPFLPSYLSAGAISAGAVGLALVLDATVGEPPDALHPVAWFGQAVDSVDREWARPRRAGAVAAGILPLAAGAVAAVFVVLAGLVHPVAALVVTGLWLFVTTSMRRLVSTVATVSVASDRDLPAARQRLRALAGRDASDLSPGQVRSAAVESGAENLADGLIAPLLAFAIGSLAGPAIGAAAAVWAKGVNTMDSMLGYRSKPVGWGAARLDDQVMWLPARVSAGLLATAALAPAALGRARSWLSAVPSPNSGWPMGTLAAALDVRLEKPGVYVLNPDADLPTVADARRGVRTVAVAGLLAYLGSGLLSVAWGMVR
jgi:adenosylcobinamide-phosphate synthase